MNEQKTLAELVAVLAEDAILTQRKLDEAATVALDDFKERLTKSAEALPPEAREVLTQTTERSFPP